jgi:hypothetical protein
MVTVIDAPDDESVAAMMLEITAEGQHQYVHAPRFRSRSDTGDHPKNRLRDHQHTPGFSPRGER